MDKILVDLRFENEIIRNMFGKDCVSVDDILNKLYDLHWELVGEQEKYEDFKRDVEDNYRPISVSEQLDISDRNFI